MEWIPTGCQPALFCSSRTKLGEGHCIRGGVPICWPWFADHRGRAHLPLHGLVHSRYWSHDLTTTDQEGVTLRFWLEDDESTRELWPHRFRLEAEILLGQRLRICMRARNRDTVPFFMGGALHPYFAVSSLAAVDITGLEGTRFFDKTDQVEKKGGITQGAIVGEVDRIYRSSGAVQIQDRGWNRSLVIEARGHCDTVVWNPGAVKTLEVDDLMPHDYDRFVAIEPALPTPDLLLQPGDEHVLELRVAMRVRSQPAVDRGRAHNRIEPETRAG
jgi:glucose-6-phosphate 1-epimerase